MLFYFDGEILEVTEACANILNLARACVANGNGSCHNCGKATHQDREYQNPNNRGGRRKTQRRKCTKDVRKKLKREENTKRKNKDTRISYVFRRKN